MHEADLVRVGVGLALDAPGEAADRERGDRPGQGERRVADPARIQLENRLLPIARLVCGTGRRAVQQFAAQPVGLGGAQTVQGQRMVPLAVGGSGADHDPGQAEQAVQGMRGHVDGPHPVKRSGNCPPAQQSVPQLDLLAGDAVSGGEPSADREGDHDGRARQAPCGAVPAAASGEDERDQRWDGADEFHDGVHEQHAGVESAPLLSWLAGCRGCGRGGQDHVASPSASLVRCVS